MKRIATEEAFCTPEVAAAICDLTRNASKISLDLRLLRAVYDNPAPGSMGAKLLQGLLDLEDERLRIMDENKVDMHILSLTSPGVQMFDAAIACEFASRSNDILAQTISLHPGRFAGLASFAPHSPARAVGEMERAIRRLRLNGFIVNSHTNGEYLDDPKFWPILEAAEGLNKPLYLHPRAPSDGMAEPFRDYGIEGAMWGYGVEAGTHVVRLIASGVFDRFPKLMMIIGHMGEAIPFWLWRLDFMHDRAVATNRAKKLELKPSEYFRRNFTITTSGVESPEALQYCINVLGAERVMWAIDHPYQPTAPAVAFMDSVPIPVEQREMIYHRNAERVFGIL